MINIQNFQPLIKFIGDIYLSKYPLFIQYKPKQHNVKGLKTELIRQIVKKGDILFRRYNNYLNTRLTPGYWGHVGGCTGKEDYVIDNHSVKQVPTIVHAIGRGVVKETVLDFCRTDSIAILRLDLSEDQLQVFTNKLNSLIGKPYDYSFKSGNDNYYCTELINTCLNNKFKNYTTVYGLKTLLPDSIYHNNIKYIFYEARH